ncbi:hypothetical protein AB1Y20_005489 [Prymnesium parvum]|uniref:XPG-I domain-containing protein n=1 Tax=Prymnesium parvum TaxID=97485 RepID=A0AB34J7D9_PRYPA
MTVVGLWHVLKRYGCLTTLHGPDALQFLEGKRLALDFSFDLVNQLTLQGGSSEINTHDMARKLVFERVVWLLRHGAQVIGCGDGIPPAEKAHTLTQRFASRSHGAHGGGRANQAFLRLTREVETTLAMLGCPSIVGETLAEGEARAAALCHLGFADAVISPDSDALIHGSPVVIKRVDVGSDARKAELEFVSLATVRARLGFGAEGLLALALLLGNDMWEGAAGAGVVHATDLVRFLVTRAGGGAEGEAKALEEVITLGESALSEEESSALEHTHCKGFCKVCGHAHRGKQHGRRGCVECGVVSGCTPTDEGALVGTEQCPCPFHRTRMLRLLARTRKRAHGDAAWTTASARHCRDAFHSLREHALRDVEAKAKLQNLNAWWHEGRRPACTSSALDLLAALRPSADSKGVSDTVAYRLRPLALEWDMRVVSQRPEWQGGELSNTSASALRGCDAHYHPLRYKSNANGFVSVEYRALKGPSEGAAEDTLICQLRRSLIERFAPALPQEIQSCP